MQFDPNKAIYLQIADHIMNRIMDGTFSTDQRVPSVRELAAEMEVNPNTTVRSYEWLEQRGIIFNRRGCGYFVAANGHEIVSGMRRAEFYADELPRFFERIRAPEFIACMEDVLDVYELPYDEKHPVVCMDEKPYQLLGEARDPLPMIPGSDRKTDSEYVRNGTVSIFAFVEALGGVHHVSVREHRTAVDWAEEIKYLVDTMYPDAEKIVLVMDNLNTHKPASLYKRYPPEEARRITKKLEIHYTPKHGSWLDIAEIELNVMTRQCLSRRIAEIGLLRRELSAWETERNTLAAKVNWHFRTSDARTKLSSLYPTFTTAS